MRIAWYCIYIIQILAVIFIGCITNPSDESVPPGSKTPKISGRLFQPDGVTPAAGATVSLRSKNLTASITGNTLGKKLIHEVQVYTEEDGTFRMESCDPGVYIIDAIDEKSQNAVRADSIIITDTNMTCEVSPLLLDLPGAIKGNAVLSNGGDAGNVFVLVFGSDRFVQADNQGNFIIGALPYGKYELKIICLLQEYAGSRMIPVEVTPGDTITLDTIYFEQQGIYIPENVLLYYDTLPQIVNLSWKAADYTNIKGYNIYRYDQATERQYSKEPINGQIPVVSSMYKDSTVECDKSYIYGITTVASDGKESQKSRPVSVTTTLSIIIDTLVDTTVSGIPKLVEWKSDNEIVVTYKEGTVISRVTYDSKLNRLAATETNLPFSFKSGFVVDNENLFIHNPFDSIIRSCDSNGRIRFECNLHRIIISMTVRNDTIYASTMRYKDSPYDFRLDAYDTTGIILFNMGDSSRLSSVFRTTDKNIYSVLLLETVGTMGFGQTNWILRKHDFVSSTTSNHEIMISGMPFFMDANNDVYVTMQDMTLKVFNFDSGIKMKVLDGFVGSPYNQGVSINGRGVIAALVNTLSGVRVVILKQP